MKRAIINFGLFALFGLLLISCEEETRTVFNTDTPVLTVSTLTISAAAGQYGIPYTISNAVDGGAVYASDDVRWITDISVGSGEISITVDENTSDVIRSGNVTIDYVYTDNGISKAVSEKVGVIQTSASDPVVTVQPNSIFVSYIGGSSKFDYEIRNVADNGEVSCSADVDWIGDFDYSDYGTVGFTFDVNGSEELRSGNITVAYEYSGVAVNAYVTVVQDHIGMGGDDDRDGPTEMIGTYTAHGTVFGIDYDPSRVTDWEVKIYSYDGYETGYDYWYDGIVPWTAGMYETYGDHRASAGIFMDVDGTLHIPTQVFNITSDGYYLGCTPCTDTTGGYSFSREWPDLVLTYNESTGSWVSDNGVFLCDFASKSISTFIGSFIEVVHPGFTLTKKSDSTSLSDDTNRSERNFSRSESDFAFIAIE